MTPVAEAVAEAAAGRVKFSLPPDLEASVPPEARGVTRDAVRMMVAHRDGVRIDHTYFSELPRVLAEGDLVVVNTSGTLAAEVSGLERSGRALEVRLSTERPDGRWTVECRSGGKPHLGAEAGEVISLADGATVTLVEPFAVLEAGVRLWVADVSTPVALHSFLAVHGRP
ncbi:MAG TPA: S-adenosylmethionine:tRNA ribosyltransferase-isomerase, partial [Acidimicrobiales bacterium]|nr:S-adenosylmethionine:tRNA ribosyltransferase-isomerase [Acidimicrobiales bacterium]